MHLYDQHLHSRNSFDSKTPPAENVERAIEVGLKGLTFTEHFDTHPDEWDHCVYDDVRIEAGIAELRVRYGRRIFIGKGIEVSYQPQLMDFILDFLASHRFDVVLLSVHWAFGKPVHVRKHFEHLGAKAFINLYLEAVRDATAHVAKMKRQGHQPFDILGHLDFAKRYANPYFNFDGPIDAPETIDEILANCLEANLIPEINTSTLRNKMAAPMPGPEVVDRYAAMGGTMMSLGSDAHSPQCVGSHFDAALQIMREAGIRELAAFKNRKLQPEPVA